MHVLLDANVLVAANSRDTHASAQCAAECARVLLETQTTHVLLEDTTDLIFNEYKRYCNFQGQPGPGDRFFLWFIQNRWTPSVQRVDIGDVDDVTANLPGELQAMDRSDHKWIAVYLNGNADVLFNALDSDWQEHAAAMSDANVNVIEICS